MRTSLRTSLTIIGIAALMTITSVALGAPGGSPGKPDKPAEEPIAGLTCTQNSDGTGTPWYLNPDIKYDDFSFVLDRDTSHECFDVIPPEAGIWRVTVTATGSGTRSLTIVPRDSVGPGDSCGGVQLRGDAIYAGDIALPDPSDTRFDDFNGGVIPLATVNACLGNADFGAGETGEFSELVDRAGVLTIEHDPIPGEVHPLALQAFAGSFKRGSSILVEVDLPPLDG
jgi:hypothetical protein